MLLAGIARTHLGRTPVPRSAELAQISAKLRDDSARIITSLRGSGHFFHYASG